MISSGKRDEDLVGMALEEAGISLEGLFGGQIRLFVFASLPRLCNYLHSLVPVPTSTLMIPPKFNTVIDPSGGDPV